MFRKSLILTIIFCFFFTSLGPIPKAHAQGVLGLPEAGQMISLSPAYQPVIIRGLTVHKDNPFLFDFIVDVGQDKASGEPLKKEGEKLIKYFLASLAIPDKDVWVNLSPYEKNKMVPDALGQTDMGRDLLAQDYILKQITASLIYPEKELGKKFWDKVYTKAQQQFGTTNIPVNTFNKVWIMADRAEVFERNQTAFVVDSHLKVMLEEDYLALQKHTTIDNTHNVASQIVREIILPELEKEVNTGKNFTNLRQIFNSVILSSWYKKNLKDALLNQVYADKAKIKGIDLNDPAVKQEIYEQYLKAYKKGVFNYIKDDINASNGQATPRKYFSGGVVSLGVAPVMTSNPAMLKSSLAGANLVYFNTLASVNGATIANSSAAMSDDQIINVVLISLVTLVVLGRIYLHGKWSWIKPDSVIDILFDKKRNSAEQRLKDALKKSIGMTQVNFQSLCDTLVTIVTNSDVRLGIDRTFGQSIVERFLETAGHDTRYSFSKRQREIAKKAYEEAHIAADTNRQLSALTEPTDLTRLREEATQRLAEIFEKGITQTIEAIGQSHQGLARERLQALVKELSSFNTPDRTAYRRERIAGYTLEFKDAIEMNPSVFNDAARALMQNYIKDESPIENPYLLIIILTILVPIDKGYELEATKSSTLALLSRHLGNNPLEAILNYSRATLGFDPNEVKNGIIPSAAMKKVKAPAGFKELEFGLKDSMRQRYLDFGKTGYVVEKIPIDLTDPSKKRDLEELFRLGLPSGVDFTSAVLLNNEESRGANDSAIILYNESNVPLAWIFLNSDPGTRTSLMNMYGAYLEEPQTPTFVDPNHAFNLTGIKVDSRKYYTLKISSSAAMVKVTAADNMLNTLKLNRKGSQVDRVRLYYQFVTDGVTDDTLLIRGLLSALPEVRLYSGEEDDTVKTRYVDVDRNDLPRVREFLQAARLALSYSSVMVVREKDTLTVSFIGLQERERVVSSATESISVDLKYWKDTHPARSIAVLLNGFGINSLDTQSDTKGPELTVAGELVSLAEDDPSLEYRLSSVIRKNIVAKAWKYFEAQLIDLERHPNDPLKRAVLLDEMQAFVKMNSGEEVINFVWYVLDFAVKKHAELVEHGSENRNFIELLKSLNKRIVTVTKHEDRTWVQAQPIDGENEGWFIWGEEHADATRAIIEETVSNIKFPTSAAMTNESSTKQPFDFTRVFLVGLRPEFRDELKKRLEALGARVWIPREGDSNLVATGHAIDAARKLSSNINIVACSAENKVVAKFTEAGVNVEKVNYGTPISELLDALAIPGIKRDLVFHKLFKDSDQLEDVLAGFHGQVIKIPARALSSIPQEEEAALVTEILPGPFKNAVEGQIVLQFEKVVDPSQPYKTLATSWVLNSKQFLKLLSVLMNKDYKDGASPLSRAVITGILGNVPAKVLVNSQAFPPAKVSALEIQPAAIQSPEHTAQRIQDIITGQGDISDKVTRILPILLGVLNVVSDDHTSRWGKEGESVYVAAKIGKKEIKFYFGIEQLSDGSLAPLLFHGTEHIDYGILKKLLSYFPVDTIVQLARDGQRPVLDNPRMLVQSKWPNYWAIDSNQIVPTAQPTATAQSPEQVGAEIQEILDRDDFQPRPAEVKELVLKAKLKDLLEKMPDQHGVDLKSNLNKPLIVARIGSSEISFNIAVDPIGGSGRFRLVIFNSMRSFDRMLLARILTYMPIGTAVNFGSSTEDELPSLEGNKHWVTADKFSYPDYWIISAGEKSRAEIREVAPRQSGLIKIDDLSDRVLFEATAANGGKVQISIRNGNLYYGENSVDKLNEGDYLGVYGSIFFKLSRVRPMLPIYSLDVALIMEPGVFKPIDNNVRRLIRQVAGGDIFFSPVGGDPLSLNVFEPSMDEKGNIKFNKNSTSDDSLRLENLIAILISLDYLPASAAMMTPDELKRIFTDQTIVIVDKESKDRKGLIKLLESYGAKVKRFNDLEIVSKNKSSMKDAVALSSSIFFVKDLKKLGIENFLLSADKLTPEEAVEALAIYMIKIELVRKKLFKSLDEITAFSSNFHGQVLAGNTKTLGNVERSEERAFSTRYIKGDDLGEIPDGYVVFQYQQLDEPKVSLVLNGDQMLRILYKIMSNANAARGFGEAVGFRDFINRNISAIEPANTNLLNAPSGVIVHEPPVDPKHGEGELELNQDVEVSIGESYKFKLSESVSIDIEVERHTGRYKVYRIQGRQRDVIAKGDVHSLPRSLEDFELTAASSGGVIVKNTHDFKVRFKPNSVIRIYERYFKNPVSNDIWNKRTFYTRVIDGRLQVRTAREYTEDDAVINSLEDLIAKPDFVENRKEDLEDLSNVEKVLLIFNKEYHLFVVKKNGVLNFCKVKLGDSPNSDQFVFATVQQIADASDNVTEIINREREGRDEGITIGEDEEIRLLQSSIKVGGTTIDVMKLVSDMDAAMASAAMAPGGIDLATSQMQWKVAKDGKGVEMDIDPAMIARIKKDGINSLSAVVFRITPIVNIWPIVGLKDPSEVERLSKV